jgi:coenzyme Q-binding protein COQ10
MAVLLDWVSISEEALLPHFREIRCLPFERARVFDLVAGVERYPSFLRWCPASRVRPLDALGRAFVADVLVRGRLVHERLTARVVLDPCRDIRIEHVAGPFRHMISHWRFRDAEGGGCVVDVEIDFELRSVWLDRLVGLFFDEAVRRLVDAFAARARAVDETAPASRPERLPQPA